MPLCFLLLTVWPCSGEKEEEGSSDSGSSAPADLAPADDADARKTGLVDDYRNKFANPYRAAELGYVDEILLSRDTRSRLIEAFDSLENKPDTNPPKKHGNIPL